MNHRVMFTVLSLAALTGCATQQKLTPLTTPSGKPEITIGGKTQAEVVQGITEYCAMNGGMVEAQTTSMVTCAKVEEDFWTNVEIGYRYGSGQLLVKKQYIVTPQQNVQRILLSNVWIEINRTMGGVHRVPTSFDKGEGGERMMKQLNEIKASIVGAS